MKTYYIPVPVAEELPEKPGVYYVVNPNNYPKHQTADIARFGSNEQWYMEHGSDGMHPSHWLRPVSVSLPEEVSDDAIQFLAHDKLQSTNQQYVDGYYQGCIDVRDRLLPHLAALQERVKGLELALLQIEQCSDEGGPFNTIVSMKKTATAALTSK